MGLNVAVFPPKSIQTALTPDTLSSDILTVIGQISQVMFVTSQADVHRQ
jgi:hypothetical protein